MNFSFGRWSTVKATLLALLVTATASLCGQPISSQIAASAPSGWAATSVTLAQIVSRQRATIGQIRSARGVAVWNEVNYTTTTQSVSPLRLVYFAYATTASVNMVVAWNGRTPVGQGREKPDWSRVLAAFLIRDDTVFSIRPNTATKQGWITSTPYNPGVHERNPIVSFRLEQLCDEPVTLSDLYATQSGMASPARVYVGRDGGDEKLWVVFTNPHTPGEELLYRVNPQKGYLTEYICRRSRNRRYFETWVVIGKTGNGFWIPSRRVKYEYTMDGRVARASEWYLHSVEVNVPLAPHELSFAYFHLPPEAWPQKVQTNAPSQ